MSVLSSPLVEVATISPFLMKEIVEMGGNLMLALQVSVAPSLPPTASLSDVKLRDRSKMYIDACTTLSILCHD